MRESKRYASAQAAQDYESANNPRAAYNEIQIGPLFKRVRIEAGMTQAQIAARLRTKKSAISRIENHAEDIKLSTLEKFAQALGKKLRVTIK